MGRYGLIGGWVLACCFFFVSAWGSSGVPCSTDPADGIGVVYITADTKLWHDSRGADDYQCNWCKSHPGTSGCSNTGGTGPSALSGAVHTYVVRNSSGFPSNALVCQRNDGNGTTSVATPGRIAAGQCSAAEDSEDCNASFPGVGDSFTTTTNPGSGSSYCHALSNCKVQVSSAVSMQGQTLYTWRHTSSNCSGPEGAGGEGGEACIGNDPSFCSAGPGDNDQPDSNCGFLNDSFVCLDRIEDDGCAVATDGSRACGPDAPTPPVPDNGTPGDPADPDVTIEINNEGDRIVNWFSGGTSAGSARDPGTSGDNPYDGNDDGSGLNGSGDCEGEDCGEGEGSASGGEVCDDEPVCEGDAIQCAILEQQWRDRCPQEWNAGFSTFAQEVGLPAEGEEGSTLPETAMTLPSSLDDAGWLGGGECPADVHIELSDWGSISVPLSEWCFVFQLIGAGVMICAYLRGAHILFGS